MSQQSFMDCERTKIERWSKFQLAHKWKLRGVVLSLLVIVAMVSLKFIEGEPTWLREVLRRTLLVSFLVVILAKEKEEDEMIASLRSKAYTLAFVCGVLYALIQPIANYVVHNYIYEASKDNGFSYFQVLFFMLLVQILFFEVLKRNR